MNYCLFGASFDPPHNGHIEIIKFCLTLCDKVILMPVGQHPNKKIEANKTDRFQMACIVNKIVGSNRIILEEYELKTESINYTIDTLQYLKVKYKFDSLSLAIGSDQLSSIEHWSQFQDILLNHQVYCFLRKNSNSISKYYSNVKIIDEVNMNISSSEIRKRIKSNKQIPKSWLNNEIYNYIKNNNVY